MSADQATGPIVVRPLYEAAAAGLLSPVVPGHVPVASGRGGEDMQPLTAVEGVA